MFSSFQRNTFASSHARAFESKQLKLAVCFICVCEAASAYKVWMCMKRL